MSAVVPKRNWLSLNVTSALPRKTDIEGPIEDVRVPTAEEAQKGTEFERFEMGVTATL
jgi:hypothetical protein